MQYAVRQDDHTKPLAEGFVMGGANGTMGPFQGESGVMRPTSPYRASRPLRSPPPTAMSLGSERHPRAPLGGLTLRAVSSKVSKSNDGSLVTATCTRSRRYRAWSGAEPELIGVVCPRALGGLADPTRYVVIPGLFVAAAAIVLDG